MTDPLIETWQINDRINRYMLEAIPPEALSGVQLTGKGWNVGQQFAHIHNVRLMWLQSAAPDLLTGLAKVEKDDSGDKALLLAALTQSGEAISTLLVQALAAGGKVKGFKPHATAFLGYLCSHEGYHRAEVGIILTQSGHPLDKKVAFGLWEWGVR
jgi:uncharacterized damage-inducible protein DinB